MNSLVIGFFILYITSFNSWVGVHGESTFNVLQYGAKGDGQTDDSQAFLKAFEVLCRSKDNTPTLVVPEGYSFFVRPIVNFSGPCQSQSVHIKVMGNVLAPKRDDWGGCATMWFYFFNITRLTLDGSGVFDGQGQGWWDRKKGAGGCPRIPTALQFEKCDGLQISGLNHINGPSGHISVESSQDALQFEKCDGLQISGLNHINGPAVHISVESSQDVTISNIHINAPKDSHNTDGIDVTRSTRVNIHNNTIYNGDDCVAIKGESQFVKVGEITCGFGHGISVGSLGKNGSAEFVNNLIVRNVTFNGATSGVKIKTWPGGKGYAKDIIFDQIIVNETNYPIFIQQHYMNTPEQRQAVKVSNVTFSNIHGTCTGENAIVLDCAEIGCDDITLDNVNIISMNRKNGASAICKNVHGIAKDIISPQGPCLIEIKKSSNKHHTTCNTTTESTKPIGISSNT